MNRVRADYPCHTSYPLKKRVEARALVAFKDSQVILLCGQVDGPLLQPSMFTRVSPQSLSPQPLRLNPNPCCFITARRSTIPFNSSRPPALFRWPYLSQTSSEFSQCLEGKGHISGSTFHPSLYIRIVASKSLNLASNPWAWQGSAGFFNPSSFSLPKQNPCFQPLVYYPSQCYVSRKKAAELLVHLSMICCPHPHGTSVSPASSTPWCLSTMPTHGF